MWSIEYAVQATFYCEVTIGIVWYSETSDASVQYRVINNLLLKITNCAQNQPAIGISHPDKFMTVQDHSHVEFYFENN